MKPRPVDICLALSVPVSLAIKQTLLDEVYLKLYADGKITLRQLLLYFVSWHLSGHTIPFPLVTKERTKEYLRSLPAENIRTITEWLNEEGKVE